MVASLLQELVERDGLRTALSGRDDVTLQPILAFSLRNIAQPRYTRLLTMVTEVLLDVYSASLGLSPVVDDMFARLANKVKQEVMLQKDMCTLLVSECAIVVGSVPAHWMIAGEPGAAACNQHMRACLVQAGVLSMELAADGRCVLLFCLSCPVY